MILNYGRRVPSSSSGPGGSVYSGSSLSRLDLGAGSGVLREVEEWRRGREEVGSTLIPPDCFLSALRERGSDVEERRRLKKCVVDNDFR